VEAGGDSVGGGLGGAIDAAIEYLVSARNQGGWWRDFSDRGRLTPAGEPRLGPNSDEWVTAYVAAALAAVADRRARTAAEQALDMLLARREADVGWGYDVQSAPDADSTTWVLRLALAVHAPVSERLLAAGQFVAGHVDRHGGVATYRPSALSLPGEPKPYETVAGWCAAHTCVTAAAAGLGVPAAAGLGLPVAAHMASFLEGVQRADGSWAGYWWDDDEYTTARAAEALAPHARYRVAVARAVTWAAGRIGAAGGVWSPPSGDLSPFATSLALQVVLSSPAPDPVAAAAAVRAVRWLVEGQREDGSWVPSARLRIPEPGAVDPLGSPGTTGTYVDGKGLFTTATVLTALCAARVAGGALARSEVIRARVAATPRARADAAAARAEGGGRARGDAAPTRAEVG
jgi:hypothetical protein